MILIKINDLVTSVSISLFKDLKFKNYLFKKLNITIFNAFVYTKFYKNILFEVLKECQ